MGIAELALNQAGSPSERQLVIMDKNRDVYLTYVKSPHLRKLGACLITHLASFRQIKYGHSQAFLLQSQLVFSMAILSFIFL